MEVSFTIQALFLFIFATGKITKTPEKIISFFSSKSNFPKIRCIFHQRIYLCQPVEKLSLLFILPMSRMNDPFARILYSCFSQYHRCVSSINKYAELKTLTLWSFPENRTKRFFQPNNGKAFSQPVVFLPAPLCSSFSPPLPYLFQKSLGFQHRKPLFSPEKKTPPPLASAR